MLKMFSVKSVPSVYWSSSHPLNLRPRISTLLMLCIGLTVFGIGEALLIAAGAGVSPWVVLAQGIANSGNWSIGVATFAVSVVVLLFWIPLRQRPGVGTLLNVVVIAAAMDFSLRYLPVPENYLLKLTEIAAGILLVGLGSGLYLTANLGAGPRDGLMTGLQRLSNLPIAWVRMGIEVTVVLLGWLLGGVVGAGTLLFAFGIGWSCHLGSMLLPGALQASRHPVTRSLSVTEPDAMATHIHWMEQALAQARIAQERGEVPVGAVLVANGEIVGKGFNQPVSSHDASAHAEICAMRQASNLRQNYRLPGTTLYVTVEPCTMCAGAMVHARIDTLVFGTREPRAGAVVSQQQLLDARYYNHKVSYIEGILRDDCAELIQKFFQGRRLG